MRKLVSIKSPNGLYLSANEGGGIDSRVDGRPVITADKTQVGAWEEFLIMDAAEAGGIYIQTSGGFYLTAENGGGGRLRSDSKDPGVWETFFPLGGLILCWNMQNYLEPYGGSSNGEIQEVRATGGVPKFEINVIQDFTPAPNRNKTYMSYCSHVDLRGEVVFDPVYFGVLWDRGDTARISETLNLKRSMGINGVMIAVQGSYGDYLDHGSFDWRKEPRKLADLADYISNQGFTLHIMAGTADGGTYHDIYNGVMENVLQSISHLSDQHKFCAGYEQDMDRGGGYSAHMMDDALLLMRRVLGPAAYLLLWLQPNRCTPASYWGSNKNLKPAHPDEIQLVWIGSDSDGAWIEWDDPYNGNEQGAFYISGGLEIDAIFYQTPHGSDGPSFTTDHPGLDSHGQPRYIDRIIECNNRFLVRGTPMPGAKGHIDGGGNIHTSGVCPSIPSPDWFSQTRPRGRPTFEIGETVPYEYIRGNCSDIAVRDCVNLTLSVGSSIFGCYQK